MTVRLWMMFLVRPQNWSLLGLVWEGSSFFYLKQITQKAVQTMQCACMYPLKWMYAAYLHLFDFIHVNVNCNCKSNVLSFYEWYMHVFGKHARIHCHNDWTVALEWDWAHGEVDGIWMHFFWIRRIQMFREASAKFRLPVTLARTTRADAFRVAMYIIRFDFDLIWGCLRYFSHMWINIWHNLPSFVLLGGSSCRRNSDWAVSSQGYREDHGSADPGDDLQRDGRAWQ